MRRIRLPVKARRPVGKVPRFPVRLPVHAGLSRARALTKANAFVTCHRLACVPPLPRRRPDGHALVPADLGPDQGAVALPDVRADGGGRPRPWRRRKSPDVGAVVRPDLDAHDRAHLARATAEAESAAERRRSLDLLLALFMQQQQHVQRSSNTCSSSSTAGSSSSSSSGNKDGKSPGSGTTTVQRAKRRRNGSRPPKTAS